jgi:uncharacterized protein YehS (DUF1456 family)
MTNNDVLRRIRYILDLNDARMMALFALGGREVTRAKVSDWLKKDDDPAFAECPDEILASFLNGLITDKRGERDGPGHAKPPVESWLTNNAVLMKLKIAFTLKAEDIQELIALGGVTISKPELSAFFRSPDHKNYRECQDQVLRTFLRGLQMKHRGTGAPGTSTTSDDEPA